MDDPLVDARRWRAAVQHLESLQRAGVGQIRKSRWQPQPVSARQVPARQVAGAQSAPSEESTPATNADTSQQVAAPVAERPATEGRITSDAVDNMPRQPRKTASRGPAPPERLAALQIVQQEVASCRLCDELARTRTQTVFGVGNPAARLCFLGEAPGADEDRKGEPFVGRAGQLLTDIIEKGMGLSRNDVYILNVLKCRPPGNRTPFPDEVTNCRGFFERQLEIIAPEFLCCLGAVAAQNLLETTQTIGRLRGRLHDYRGIKVLATYHPAYLLRNPAAKKDTWEDMKLLMHAMGMQIPKRAE